MNQAPKRLPKLRNYNANYADALSIGKAPYDRRVFEAILIQC
jgi:hypothetical protein